MVDEPITQRTVLDALEAAYPCFAAQFASTFKNAPTVFAIFRLRKDLSHESPDALLPDAIATGGEPFMMVGAIAGG